MTGRIDGPSDFDGGPWRQPGGLWDFESTAALTCERVLFCRFLDTVCLHPIHVDRERKLSSARPEVFNFSFESSTPSKGGTELEGVSGAPTVGGGPHATHDATAWTGDRAERGV